MERTQIFELMGELRLYGMKAAFDDIMATAVKRQHEPQRVVGDLLTAEISEKQARSIKYQPAKTRPAWRAPNGFAVIPAAALDPPHRAASPAVPALIGSGSRSGRAPNSAAEQCIMPPPFQFRDLLELGEYFAVVLGESPSPTKQQIAQDQCPGLTCGNNSHLESVLED